MHALSIKRVGLLLPLLLLPLVSHSQVIVNEILYSPTSKQWVEILNNTESSIDLTQYKILDAGAAVNGHGITAVSGGTNMVAPHSFAVVAKVPDDFGTVSYPLFKSSLGIKATGDTVSLKLGSAIVDSAVVSDGSATGGNSLQKNGSNWVTALPTPGAVNATESATVATASTTSETATSTINTTTVPSADASPVTSSTHYSATPIVEVRAAAKWAVGAGRARDSIVGSPIEFRATANPIYLSNASYRWTFGDGSMEDGETAVHTYDYPGEYIVVLNATSPAGSAVSRTTASIKPAELSINQANSERIEILNNSSKEANLYGRALAVGDQMFKFPMDTIITAGARISLSHAVTNLSPSDVSDVHLVVTGEVIKPEEIAIQVETEKAKQLAALYGKLNKLQNKVATLSTAETGSLQDSPPESEQSTTTLSETAAAVNASPQSAKEISNWIEALKSFFLWSPK